MSRGPAAAVVAALALLGLAPGALADTQTSSNWAGYVAHGPGRRFAAVRGSWTQPRATCTPGRATYSSVWVGIGGFSLSSRAVEQVGTRADCTRSGRMIVRAWYELVPAGPGTLAMSIRPGDRIAASLTLQGHRVRLRLEDVTQRRAFQRTLRAQSVDATSADWIVEAPSACSQGSCRTLPLADFGLAAIADARAVTVRGRSGPIADRAWRTTRLLLSDPRAAASVSALSARARRFTVAWRPRVPSS